MKNYYGSVRINDNPYRILIIPGLGSWKPNVLLSFIKHQRPHIDKIYLYIKNPLKSKSLLLINGREKVGTENLKNRKAFINHSLFDDMIADMGSNKKLRPMVTELFLKGRKLNISLASISQSYFKLAKTIRLNAIYCFIMKIPNRREIQ